MLFAGTKPSYSLLATFSYLYTALIKMDTSAYILSLEINNVRCFGEKAILDMSDGKSNWKKWTVILGDNGTGKTSLLQALALAEQKLSSSSNEVQSYHSIAFDRVSDPYGPSGISIFERENSNRYISINLFGNTFDALQIDLSNYNNGNVDIIGSTVFEGRQYKLVKIFGYGANRIMGETSLSDNLSKNSLSLFHDDAQLINAEEWLLQLDYSASKASEVSDYLKKKRDKVLSTLKDILPDIDDIKITDPAKDNIRPTLQFHTPYGWVNILQLSLGYKTMAAWIVDLAARMYERYPDSDNPLAEPAVVLVDEIDLHMHPKWQRKIFDYLDEKFPATQFIVTAHSPLVVQSAPEDANIVLLRREGNHVVIDNDIQNVHNWRIDQILSSDLFNTGLRSPAAEEWLNERKILLQKDILSDKEKMRLQELNKKADVLPAGNNQLEIEAMQVLQEAAAVYKKQTEE